MSKKWWNRNEHVGWREYRYRYHKLPEWARRWGNWLGAGNLTNDQGDPIDDYLRRTASCVIEEAFWPGHSELDVDDWQLNFLHRSPEQIERWFRKDASCLTGSPTINPQSPDRVDLGTGETYAVNVALYERIGFLRPIVRRSVPRRVLKEAS